MRTLTVGRMMRREYRRVPIDMALAVFRREFALGSVPRVVAVDAAERYAGILATSEGHAAPETAARLADIVHHKKTVLLPQMTIKEAVQMFEDRRERRAGGGRQPRKHEGDRRAHGAVRPAPLHGGAGEAPARVVGRIGGPPRLGERLGDDGVVVAPGHVLEPRRPRAPPAPAGQGSRATPQAPPGRVPARSSRRGPRPPEWRRWWSR